MVDEVESSRLRVLLADDHEIVREGIAQILDDMPGVEVVGQTSRGDEVVALSQRLRPDLVVLDYSMPGTVPSALMEQLHRRAPQVKVLILTVHESIHYAVKALESGACGYVIKSAAVRELQEAVRTVGEGEVYLSSRMSSRVIQHMRLPRKHRTGLAALSPRELELLRVLGAGLGLKACARHMSVSVSTASTHRARLMEKLGLTSTAEIIRFALENEIVG